jgi:thiol-disulfide isomerase/thioredoxin
VPVVQCYPAVAFWLLSANGDVVKGHLRGEDQAVRTLYGVGLVLVCLGLAGCSVFGKKNSSTDASSRNASGNGAVARTDVPADTSSPSPGVSGLLAGLVQDVDNHQRAGVFIQVVDLKDGKGSAAPIEVEADKNGNFTIQGLQPGHHYQLIARVKDGNQLLSGSAVATPPNPRLLIVMSEDFTTTTTPPLPKPTPLPGPKPTTTKPDAPAATIKPPSVDEEPAAKPPPESSNNVKDPSKIANDSAGQGWPKAPPADIKYVPPPPPSPSSPPPTPPLPPSSRPPSPPSNDEDPLLPKVGSGAESRSHEPTPGIVTTALNPVPSCVLVGNKLESLSLFDLDGQTWEYKRDRRGRLTLLSFWQSTSPPSLAMIPRLVEWQRTYSRLGLEIVGVANEKGSRDQQVLNVRGTRGRYSINYLTLLGGQDGSPVEQQFKVDPSMDFSFPTLVLLDETGQIVWRGTCNEQGKLAEAKLGELEIEIRKRLGRR